ncbi:MAG TPA: DM13 domain-containing protein [Acidobacteriaceae bacterium]|nr:DM13 domain-containing protein [Acidobacteriaceae bacterium]
MASLIVAGALWYLFRPEELFINKRVNEPAPFAANDAAQPIYTGTLSEKLHETSGRATVYRQPDGTLTLRLTDFHTSNGSDVHVVLTTANDPALQSKVPGKALSSIDIGELKGNEGDQEYKLPPNIDFARYSTVAIYCERFKAVFGTATLQPF